MAVPTAYTMIVAITLIKIDSSFVSQNAGGFLIGAATSVSVSPAPFLVFQRINNAAIKNIAVPINGVTEVHSINACAQRSINSPTYWAAVILSAEPVER